jgi:hypothetical protein
MSLQQVAQRRVTTLEIVHEAPRMPALLERPGRTAAAPSHAEWHTSIAVRSDQFRAAEELVGRRYAWRGYQTDAKTASAASCSQEGLRVVLLAQYAGQLMGTLTVRRDATQGLLAEKAYVDEIQQMRSGGRRLGELVKLAIEEAVDWRAALDALVQSAYLVTRVVQGLTDVVIEVNPRHVRFYERVFGFVVAGAERFCERASAPCVLLALDLERFGQRLQLAA